MAVDTAPFSAVITAPHRKEQILVDVDVQQEDAVLVSFTQNGQTYRGALLKIKPWSCPYIPPLDSATSSSAVASTGESNEDVPKAALDAAASEGNSQTDLSTATANGPVPVEKPTTEQNPDFAALQHRWSYFQRNVLNLPRKNFPSKRERDRLETTPKLRPRNFLCTRCKYALPGFSRPTSQSNNANLAASSSTDADASNLVTEQDASTSSHLRKGKIPLKRASISRPILGYDEFSPYANTPTPESFIDESLNRIGVKGNRREKAGGPTPVKRKKLAEEGLPKLSLPVEKPNPITKKELPVVATILTPPSGDNGLKMKIKFNSTSPTHVPEVKPKREKKPPKPIIETPPVADDEDDDDRPRLRIDDSSFGDEPSEEQKHPSRQPSVQENQSLQSSSSEPVQKKKKSKHSGNSSSGASDKRALDSSSYGNIEEPSANDSLPKPVARAVDQCLTKDGRTFSVGDIVWGKLTGYPWWPGKINHIVVCDDPMLERSASALTLSDPRALPTLQYQEAQIEWYGQKSSISYIEVCQLTHFIEDYDKKHKPKQRVSGYQEAIKLALDAVNQKNLEEPEERDIFSELAAIEANAARHRASAGNTASANNHQLATHSSGTHNAALSHTPSNSASQIYDFTMNDALTTPPLQQQPNRSHPHSGFPQSNAVPPAYGNYMH